MKADWKKIARLTSWSIAIASVFITTGFINQKFGREKCREVVIDIIDARNYGFVDEGDITEILNSRFNTPVSQKLQDINTYAIEQHLNNHENIERAEVFISIDRKLHITIDQRKAVLRVYTKNGSFYIDQRGCVMPVSRKYTAHVPVVSGEIDFNISQLYEWTNSEDFTLDPNFTPQLYIDLVNLSNFIDSNPFWNAQIEQLYVDKESQFEMIPRVGNHTIVLGEIYDLEEKFRKLDLFYKEGLSRTGWNEYKTINLKFKDQVVCTKRY